MFGFKKKSKKDVMTASVTGKLIPLTLVNDEVFSKGMMGDGYAIIPESEAIYSPVSGEVVSIFPTGHAVGIKTLQGLEVLVHMGLDTVELNGMGFKNRVSVGQSVDKNTVLSTMNVSLIKDKGYDPTILVLCTNMDVLDTVSEVSEKNVKGGEEVVTLVYK